MKRLATILLCSMLCSCSVMLHPVSTTKTKHEARPEDLYLLVAVFIFAAWEVGGEFDKK